MKELKSKTDMPKVAGFKATESLNDFQQSGSECAVQDIIIIIIMINSQQETHLKSTNISISSADNKGQLRIPSLANSIIIIIMQHLTRRVSVIRMANRRRMVVPVLHPLTLFRYALLQISNTSVLAIGSQCTR